MRRKSRTILTIISVVIGIFSIILMLSFGFGIQKQQESSLKGLGSLTSIEVYPNAYFDPSSNGPTPTNGIITDEVIEKIKANPKVKGVLPSRRVEVQIAPERSDIELFADLSAYNIKDLEAIGIKLDNGQNIPDLKEDEYLIGSEVFPMKMMKNSSNMGEDFGELERDLTFDFNTEKLNFILGYKDDSGKDGQNIFENPKKTYKEIPARYVGRVEANEYLEGYKIVISEKTAEKLNRLNKEFLDSLSDEGTDQRPQRNTVKTYDNLLVFTHSLEDIEEVKEEIINMQLGAHSNQDFINAQRESARVIQLVLGGIGSIALLVAAIGISNTMLMSIQERTKEIGVMKVIGAQIKDIRKMFLLEAMLIGLLGGIVGVLLSMGASEFANNLAQANIDPSIITQTDEWMGISFIPIWLPFVAVSFSALVGLLAGYLPAHRATKLSAIEAIRTN